MELVIVPNVDALSSFKRAKLSVGDSKLLNTRFAGTVYYSLGGFHVELISDKYKIFQKMCIL